MQLLGAYAFSAGHIGTVTSVPSDGGVALLGVFLRARDGDVHLAPLSAGRLGTVTLVPGGGDQESVTLNVPPRGMCYVSANAFGGLGSFDLCTLRLCVTESVENRVVSGCCNSSLYCAERTCLF